MKTLPLLRVLDKKSALRYEQVDNFTAQLPLAIQRLRLEGDKLAMFLAQVAHESDSFKALEEYASGSAYEGRKDLGNVVKGDGVRFKGRGYIQLTGRCNYTKFTEWYQANFSTTNINFVTNPEVVATPFFGMMATVFFWEANKLNQIDDFRVLTRRINGGYNGYEHRVNLYKSFQKLINEND